MLRLLRGLWRRLRRPHPRPAQAAYMEVEIVARSPSGRVLARVFAVAHRDDLPGGAQYVLPAARGPVVAGGLVASVWCRTADPDYEGPVDRCSLIGAVVEVGGGVGFGGGPLPKIRR